MKTDKEILDLLGSKIVAECFDGSLRHFESIKRKENLPEIYKEKKDFLNTLNDDNYVLFRKMIMSNVELVLFEFFNIIEENEEFKIIYEEDGKQVDLVKISEMLKAELIIENGWIERFSKEK
jgi:hypothetical protein